MKKVAFRIILSSFLVACGSGGDSAAPQTSVQPLAKYAGSWTSTCEASFAPSTSRNSLYTLALLANGELSFNSTYRYFNGLTCTGATVAEIVFPVANARFDSAVTVGADSIDRITYSEPAGNITATGSIVTQTATDHVMTYPGGTSTEPLTQTAFTAKSALKLLSTTQYSTANAPADSAGYPANFVGARVNTKQ